MCVEIKFEEKNPKMIQPNSRLYYFLKCTAYFILFPIQEKSY